MRGDVGNPATGEAPTKVRYGVLGFACALSMITYLDRVCFGSAGPYIVGIKDLGLNSVADLGLTFTAFGFAYAAFEVPSGWLGDVFGPRSTLIRIVIWWSAFTAITGLVGLPVFGMTIGFWSLVGIRFLFGMGEAGAYPNITRSLHNWFPYHERGFAQGMVWMSGRLMGGLTPLIWALLVTGVTWGEDSASKTTISHLQPLLGEWRQAFYLFGILGIIWCVLFALWFRNRPEEKPTVNQAELSLIRGAVAEPEGDHSGVPWGKLLTSSNLWTLCLMYACGAYGWYFNITYLPTFLEQQYGVPKTSLAGALYKGGPLWLGAAGCLIGGILTDRFIRRTGNQKLGRRIFGIVGHSLCAIAYFSCLFTYDAFSFFVAISLAAFFNDLTMGSSWATCQDIGKRYAGIVAGCMNTVGNMGGALAGYVTGMILNYSLDSHAQKLGATDAKALSAVEQAAGLWQGYQINFISFGIVYVIAVICWLRIDSTKPVAQKGAAHGTEAA
jgi:MFS family permease